MAAVRKPTVWDHLLSDREEEREAIASRLRAEEASLLGRKAGLMRALREQELEAQLSTNDGERALYRERMTDLAGKVGTTQNDLEWVASRQNQNSRDWDYWPNRETYRKPSASAVTPVVEAPARNDFHQSSNR